MATFIYTVGASRTYATIQAAWAALPNPVPSGDIYRIEIQKGTYGPLYCLDNPKDVQGRVIICPEATAAWYEDSSPVTRIDASKGVLVTNSNFGTIQITKNITLLGLMISGGGSGYAQINNENTVTGFEMDRCILLSETDGELALKFPGDMSGVIKNSIFITNTTTPSGICSITGPVDFTLIGNTIIRPAGSGTAWLTGTWPSTKVIDNAIFGFASADPTLIHASSTNNATDAGTAPGSSGLTGLSASSQFVDATFSTLDLRLKTGNSLAGAGATNALITVDALGTTRPNPPAIGALDVAGGGGTTNYTLSANYGTYTITGSDAYADYGMNAVYGTYQITGFSVADPSGKYTMQADTGFYNITGQNARLVWSGAPVSKQNTPAKIAIHISMRI